MNSVMRRLSLQLLGVSGLTLAAAPAAPAQYFGRNQVQYQTFDFRVLRTDHFDVYFYPAEREAAQLAARMAERWYARLSAILGDTLRGRQPLILYASHAQFEQTNAIQGEIGEGTGGVTEALKRRVVLPIAVSLRETDHVLGHELVHAFQYDITGRGRSGLPAATGLPLWFIEGMAEYLSLGPVDPHTAMWLRDAVQQDRLPKVTDLDNPKYFPYRYGQAFWAYVGGRWGDEAIGRLLRAAGRSRDAILALRRELEIEPDSLSAQWHAALRAAYQPLASRARPPSELGQPVLTEETAGGKLNVAPALSPDGSRVAFLSERDVFSIEMYVADAATGRVERKLTSTALDPHLQSLEFVQSAGSWHPDGRHFAFAAIVRGRPALEIMDLDRGETEREVRLPDLDEIFGPSWSPDGRELVFSAQVGGLTDLFVYDLDAGRLRRLTHDAYADFEPAWSPDGRSIAFVTDRFGTSIGRLRYGDYRLALLDLGTGRVTALPSLGAGKQISPQWADEGRSLYFVGDPDGISNVYRLDVASGSILRVTDLYTGASGITALSPVLAAASRSDRLLTSVYRHGRYEVYRLDSAQVLAGRPAPAASGGERAAELPPYGSPDTRSRVAEYLADASTGLPDSASFRVDRYRPSLSLDYIAQPYLAAGVDRLGIFLGGGAALYWSSMLGDRQLATALQVNGGLRDIGAQVAYVNLRRRLNWGLVVSQVPYVTAAFGESIENVNGQPALVDRELIYRQTNRQVAALAQYPFSRVQRVEFEAGVRQIGFDAELHEIAYGATGARLFDRDSSLPAPGSLVLGEATAALVYDNSIFGGTGPVRGQRYRLELSPTVGSLRFVGALADVRKYVMPMRPVTLALRVLHYGRYGRDAEDSRLAPLFVGYQSLVRGYDNGSFDASECQPTATSACPVFDQLLGSRILVGNAELRLPLLGPLGVLTRSGAVPPIDLVGFADGGVAWNAGESPALFGGTRRAVRSLGAGLRVNLFGMLLAELDYVHPLDRPQKGWYVEFGLIPGF